MFKCDHRMSDLTRVFAGVKLFFIFALARTRACNEVLPVLMRRCGGPRLGKFSAAYAWIVCLGGSQSALSFSRAHWDTTAQDDDILLLRA